MAEYDSAIALARRLVQKKGRPIKLVEKSTTEVDPAKPWLGKTTTPAREVQTFGAFFQVEFLEQLIRLGSGRETPVRSSLTTEEEMVLVPADGLPFRVRPGMLVEDRGNRKEIKRLEQLEPGTQPVLYMLVVAR